PVRPRPRGPRLPARQAVPSPARDRSPPRCPRLAGPRGDRAPVPRAAGRGAGGGPRPQRAPAGPGRGRPPVPAPHAPDRGAPGPQAGRPRGARPSAAARPRIDGPAAEPVTTSIGRAARAGLIWSLVAAVSTRFGSLALGMVLARLL